MSQKTRRPRGILSFVPKEIDVPALYVQTKRFTEWIENAKANKEHKGRHRKFLNLLSMDSAYIPGRSADKTIRGQNDS